MDLRTNVIYFVCQRVKIPSSLNIEQNILSLEQLNGTQMTLYPNKIIEKIKICKNFVNYIPEIKGTRTKLKVYYPLDFETVKRYYLSNGSFWRYVFYMKND